jgi:hypothetical protein
MIPTSRERKASAQSAILSHGPKSFCRCFVGLAGGSTGSFSLKDMAACRQVSINTGGLAFCPTPIIQLAFEGARRRGAAKFKIGRGGIRAQGRSCRDFGIESRGITFHTLKIRSFLLKPGLAANLSLAANDRDQSQTQQARKKTFSPHDFFLPSLRIRILSCQL